MSLIGLDLSGKPEVFGWFLLAITGYFLITSLVLGALDLVKYYLPYFIVKKGANVTGSVIGLTEDECQSENFEHYLDHPEVGTVSSELLDIQRQRKSIEANYHSRYVNLANATRLLFDLAFPTIFSAISIFVITGFLWPSCSQIT
ncbi:hypothetical protein [Neptuniibacter marinus]|uniref:hypothetical protein n=1 Tax=Neptuniibacter marinus TaxID=1806670 RepID=UPI003B5B3FBC